MLTPREYESDVRDSPGATETKHVSERVDVRESYVGKVGGV